MENVVTKVHALGNFTSVILFVQNKKKNSFQFFQGFHTHHTLSDKSLL